MMLTQTKKELMKCGAMIEVIHGYLDLAIKNENLSKTGSRFFLNAVDLLNELNKMLLKINDGLKVEKGKK